MGSPLRDEHAEVFYECVDPAAWGTCPFFTKTHSLRVKTGAGTYDGWRARGLLRGPWEERSFKGIQSEGGGGLRLFYMMMPFLT
jgi:hypothetical protein